MAKQSQAALIAEAMRKGSKGSSIRKGVDGAKAALRQVIPTDIEVLDNWVLGVGGLPVGRIIELCGSESAGKSSLGYQFIAAAQRAGGVGCLAENEHGLIPDRVEAFGCQRDEILLLEPPSIEAFMNPKSGELRNLLDSIPSGVGPNIVVWDSLAATPTSAEISSDTKKKVQPGTHARVMSQSLRAVTPMFLEAQVVFVIINQLRANIGVSMGPSETTPGGNIVKFMSTIRLQLWGGKGEENDFDDKISQNVTIKAIKNRIAYPNRKAKARLHYADGWVNQWPTINFAKDRGLIAKSKQYTPDTHALALQELKHMEGWHGYEPRTVAAGADDSADEAEASASSVGGDKPKRKAAKKRATKSKGKGSTKGAKEE